MDKAVYNNPRALKSVRDCNITSKICHPSTIQFVLKWYKTDEICDEVGNMCFFVFDSIPDWYKTQEMYDRVVSEDPFLDSILPLLT